VVGLPSLGQVVREEAHDPLIVLHARPEVLDGQLVVLGHVHLLDGVRLHELLLLGQQLAEEVLVDHELGRRV
jgi:hypothetical protein